MQSILDQDDSFETSSVKSCSTTDSRTSRTPTESLSQMIDRAIANQEWLNLAAQALLSAMEKSSISAKNP